jgi:hypothetical protein
MHVGVFDDQTAVTLEAHRPNLVPSELSWSWNGTQMKLLDCIREMSSSCLLVSAGETIFS